MSDSSKERPLDCCQCSRKLTTRYREVKETVLNEYYLCAECPHLQNFLHTPSHQVSDKTLASITCGECQTSLLDIQKGELLGCSECYEIFDAYLLERLKKDLNLQYQESAQSLYLGHQPGEFKELGASQQLFALNEALNEMVFNEDYEQAASIRDQINELKKKLRPS